MNNYKLLILDDDLSILNALKSLLEIEGYEVYCANNIEEAKKIISFLKPHLYILDVYLGKGNGIEFLKELRKDYKINAPIIILTGFPSSEILKEGFKNDCDFFLQKDKAIPSILSIVKILLDQEAVRKEKGGKNVNFSLKTIPYLIEMLNKNKNIKRILVKIDSYPLFSFRNILGKNFSQTIEEMLFNFFYNLYEQIPPKFFETMVTESCADMIISFRYSEKLEKEIKENVKISMIKTIRFMRKKIKEGFHFFDVKIIPFEYKSKNISLDLYHSLQMKEKLEPIPLDSLNYDFFYQEIFETNSLNIRGYEIFARPEDIFNVEKFYKKLEYLNIHSYMDSFNLTKIKKIIPFFPSNSFIGVNLSPSSLLLDKFPENIIGILGNFSKNIYLEFTERTPYLTSKIVREKISYLKERGFLIAIDDVGAGYNNISAILNIEPNLIKIDKVLVKGISKDEYKKSAFSSILELSKKMGAQVCAEGVEMEEDFLALRELKPDFMQGFYLHYPKKIEENILKKKGGINENIIG